MSVPSPLISIVVAVYNGAATLQRCLQSITSQSYPNIELIVMDGGSTDGSQEILKAFQEKIAYWESQPDRGIYHAWNKALAKVNGDWICFLGSDDYLWSSEIIEKVATALAEVPAPINVAYGQIALVSPKGDVLEVLGEPWEKAKALFCQEMTIPHPGLMHRRVLFERHGQFDESFRIVGDYELLLRELVHNDAHFLGKLCVVGMQHGGASMISKIPFAGLKESLRAKRKNGIHGVPDKARFIWVCTRMILSDLSYRALGANGHKALANVYRLSLGKPTR